MELPISVDLISDLYLQHTDQFDWTGKPTSLFCAIAGGLSDDLKVIKQTLEHLGKLYRGVFYIDGSYEHLDLSEYHQRVDDLQRICDPLRNVIYMHNHAVLLNGVALVAVNGWFENSPNISDPSDILRVKQYKNEDLAYLSNTIRNLQLHRDAQKIIVFSSSVPSETLLFGKKSLYYDYTDKSFEPGLALLMDSERKVTHWLYGGTDLIVDQTILTRRFVNNPRIEGQPYWPKQVLI